MSVTTAVRVLVVDDEKVVHDSIAMMLGLLDGLEVVATAVDGADALRQVQDLDPDVVLMDLSIRPWTVSRPPATWPCAAPARGRSCRPPTPTTSGFRCLAGRARGLLTKDAGADEIRSAVLSVAAGEAQLDPWGRAASWRPWPRAPGSASSRARPRPSMTASRPGSWTSSPKSREG